MISLDEDALICDLAETYQIYDYKQLPPSKVAVFSCGLRDDARIKMYASKQQVSLETMLLAGIADRLSILVWFQTKDGQKGKNRPKPITALLTKTIMDHRKNDESVIVYSSGEEFEKARNRLIGGE